MELKCDVIILLQLTRDLDVKDCKQATLITYYVVLNSVRQHNHFVTQGNYKA